MFVTLDGSEWHEIVDGRLVQTYSLVDVYTDAHSNEDTIKLAPLTRTGQDDDETNYFVLLTSRELMFAQAEKTRELYFHESYGRWLVQPVFANNNNNNERTQTLGNKFPIDSNQKHKF